MTKKKTLLKEGTVRQFMKLANIKPLTPGFVEKLYEGEEVQEEEVQEEGTKKDDELNDTEDGGARGEKKGDKAYVNEQEEVEVEDEVELGGEEVLGGEEEEEVDVTALVRAIADAVEAHTGVSVDVADEDAGEEVELGAEEEVELGDGEEVELGAEEEVEELEESEEVQEETQDLEEIISTIAENVTKRLEEMAKKKINKSVNEEMSMGVPGVDFPDPAKDRLKKKRKDAASWYADIAKNIKHAFPEISKRLDFSPPLQPKIDGLAKELGLKAGKDFRNYRQMKAKILDALTADAAQAEELPDMSSAARVRDKQSRKAGPFGPGSPRQSVQPIGRK